MEVIDLLMKKYGLPESFAFKLDQAMCDYWLFGSIPKCRRKSDNKQAVYLIQTTRLVAMRNPVKPDEVLMICPDIKAVKFVMNDKTVTIDDPAIIERLHHTICSAIPVQPKRKRGGQRKPENILLKNVIRELMTYCPDNYLPDGIKTDSNYSKRVFAGRVLSEYLPYLKKQSNDVLQDTVRNWI